MAEHQPQDQPQPESPQDWNQVSAQEIEQTISDAAELAYELAGDVGQANVQAYRDTSGLEPIESALDMELKQLDHLVQKTREQLDDIPAVPKGASGVPDFMSEFLSNDPITVIPEPVSQLAAQAPGGPTNEQTASHSPAPTGAQGFGTREHAGDSRMGLVGIGSLGGRSTERAATRKPGSQEPPPVLREKTHHLDRAAFWIADCGVRVLEWLDRPLARLQPSTRRALGVTAIAAFCTCLAMFLLSLLLS